jgi:beta-glucosidase
MNDLYAILKELTLEQKLSLITGKDFWHLEGLEKYGLKSIMVTDGPHGLRKQLVKGEHIGLSESVEATCYPTASLLASTWDTDLIKELGIHLGKECLSEQVSVLLGPGANIKRSPLCGRNFEYFSEDPLLSGKMAAAWINGVQSQGVGASLKHFLLNNQESHRMVVDAIVDERTMREIYLKPFEIAVKEANPWTVMCSYNKVNGTYLSENKKFLTDILKHEFKYDGLVVSDWGACNNRVLGIKAGLDLEMPASHGAHDEEIKKSIQDGVLKVEEVDLAVMNVLKLIKKGNENLTKDPVKYDVEKHHQFARKVASEGIVLLKNDQNLLPVEDHQKIALIGAFAKHPRYQGNGSSLIKPTKISTFYDAMSERYKHLSYAEGYSLDQDLEHLDLIDQALEISMNADTILIMVGLTESYESEGFDRKHLNIPKNQESLIHAISSLYKNVVVILSNGAPIIMPWKDQVSAIVESYLGGQASGLALLDVITGDINPSGKLAETFPNHLDEIPSSSNFPGECRQVIYKEGLYVGYRAYDSLKISPLFPFGHGLSYTTFDYVDLNILKEQEDLKISFKLQNTGNRDGKEVIQVYVSPEKSLVYRPLQELKAFKKIELKPNEIKEVEIKIPIKDLSIYQQGLKIEFGKYHFRIGSSSRDIKLEETLLIDTEDVIEKDHVKSYHQNLQPFKPTNEDYEILLGYNVPPIQPDKPYHLNSTIGEIKHTMVGKMLYKMVRKEYASVAGENPTLAMIEMLEASVKEMPLRSLVLFSDGKLSKNRALGMIDILNHHFLKGIWKLMKG